MWHGNHFHIRGSKGCAISKSCNCDHSLRPHHLPLIIPLKLYFMYVHPKAFSWSYQLQSRILQNIHHQVKEILTLSLMRSADTILELFVSLDKYIPKIIASAKAPQRQPTITRIRGMRTWSHTEGAPPLAVCKTLYLELFLGILYTNRMLHGLPEHSEKGNSSRLLQPLDSIRVLWTRQ